MKNTNVIPIQKIPSMLENDYQFVDLRDPYEYKKVHLTKFTNIPYEKFNLNQYYFLKKNHLFLFVIAELNQKNSLMIYVNKAMMLTVLKVDSILFCIKRHKKLTGVYSLIQWFIIKTSNKVFNFSYRNNNFRICFF